MSISNSYHTSAKSHAITSAGKLSSVQKHNARGYFAWDYDSNKIHNLIGNAAELSQDTKGYINNKFAKSIEEYNKKQRQKCRRITETPFEYFCENRSTDIANETLFQVGDMDFWSKYRIEKEIKRNGKTYIRKSYPEEIKEVMDNIFRLQAEAYGQIYKTHGDKILEKIVKAKEEAESYIASLDKDLCWKYEQLFLQPKKRDGLLKSMQLTDAELEGYERYFKVRSDLAAIEKKRLIERTSSGNMEIKLINLVAHYDEWSPHAHAVSVCSTSGYKQGLSNRVAKSVVLNKWSLEIIQDRMREIAIEEMSKHPDLFPEIEWKEKGAGRNIDYATEQYIRIKQRKLLERNERLEIAVKSTETKLDQVEEKVSELKMTRNSVQNEISDLLEQQCKLQENLAMIIADYKKADQNLREQKEQVDKWNNTLYVIESEKEYIAEVEECQDTIDHLKTLCDSLLSRKSPLRDKTIEQSLTNAFSGFYGSLCESLKKQRKYEVFNGLSEEESLSVPLAKAKADLDDKIRSGKTIAAKTRQSITHEYQQRKKTEDRSI